jgi:hypothetical protein
VSFVLALGAFLYTVLLSVLLLSLLGWRHPSMSRHYAAPLALLVVILFLAGWAGQLWLSALTKSTDLAGAVPFLIASGILALMILGAVPALRRPPAPTAPVQKQDAVPTPSGIVVSGVVFWVLLVVLVALVGIGYLIARVSARESAGTGAWFGGVFV